MSVMGFKKKSLDGGLALSEFFLFFLNCFNFAKSHIPLYVSCFIQGLYVPWEASVLLVSSCDEVNDKWMKVLPMNCSSEITVVINDGTSK